MSRARRGGAAADPVIPSSPVSAVMEWPLATITDDATVREAARVLTAEEVGALVVIHRGERLVGLVSERDVVHAVATGADLDDEVCSEIMTLQTVSVEPHDTVAEAARLMRDAHIRHLPVHDGEHVVGMVSIRDVLDVLLGAEGLSGRADA